MSVSNIAELSATEMLAAFAQGTFTPSDLVSACLRRISDLNPAINALTAFDTVRAVADAVEATTRWQEGRPKGLLDGLPIGVKDLQETQGLLTTYGSPRSRGYIPDADLPMVARLREQGAIVLAKTNVPEMGAGGNTRNPVWGATGNPFDSSLIAGGSSGGSAAALATDLLPLCTGSDTGGSLRLPAALCGVVGFRPSVDVVPHPTRTLGWSGISVLGPMARCMDDLILMLRAICGYNPDDPLSAPSDPARFDILPEAVLGELRIGISEDFGGAPVDPEIRETFRKRVAALSPHVAECRPVDLNLGYMDQVFDILRAESFVAAFGKGVEEAPEDFGRNIHDNVEIAKQFTLEDRAWAHAEQTRILRRFNARMEGLDAILLPTAPVSPFPWKEPFAKRIDGQDMDVYYRWLALAYRGSLTGGPAITIPSGKDPKGMPFGLQMLGGMHQDARLLASAKALETFLARDSETGRPRPDFDVLRAQESDLHSIVVAPPVSNGSTDGVAVSARTAV